MPDIETPRPFKILTSSNPQVKVSQHDTASIQSTSTLLRYQPRQTVKAGLLPMIKLDEPYYGSPEAVKASIDILLEVLEVPFPGVCLVKLRALAETLFKSSQDPTRDENQRFPLFLQDPSGCLYSTYKCMYRQTLMNITRALLDTPDTLPDVPSSTQTGRLTETSAPKMQDNNAFNMAPMSFPSTFAIGTNAKMFPGRRVQKNKKVPQKRQKGQAFSLSSDKEYHRQ